MQNSPREDLFSTRRQAGFEWPVETLFRYQSSLFGRIQPLAECCFLIARDCHGKAGPRRPGARAYLFPRSASSSAAVIGSPPRAAM